MEEYPNTVGQAASEAEAPKPLQEEHEQQSTAYNRGVEVLSGAKEKLSVSVEKIKGVFGSVKSKFSALANGLKAFQQKSAVKAVEVVGTTALAVENVKKGIDAGVEKVNKAGEVVQWKAYEAVGSMQNRIAEAKLNYQFNAKYGKDLEALEAQLKSLQDGSLIQAKRKELAARYVQSGDPTEVLDFEAGAKENFKAMAEGIREQITLIRTKYRDELRPKQPEATPAAEESTEASNVAAA